MPLARLAGPAGLAMASGSTGTPGTSDAVEVDVVSAEATSPTVVPTSTDEVEVEVVSAEATSPTVVPTSTDEVEVEIEVGAPLSEPLPAHDPATRAHATTALANLMALQ
jgi:hypothetical protein